MKNKFSIFNFQFSIFLIFCVACEGMIKELDIETIGFPSKLSISAFLDGESGVFDITIMEGRSFAEINESNFQSKENIRNGEIRLYENDELIQYIPGPFDMSVKIEQINFDWGFMNGRNGSRHVLREINTRPGGVYRLEVDLEGYPTATSTAVMPVAPVVSANMDTSEIVIRENALDVSTLGYLLYHLGNRHETTFSGKYWPVSVNVADLDGQTNYYALDIYHWYENTNTSRFYIWGIGVPDLSILLDADMDTSGAFNIEQASTELYLFSMLMLSNASFLEENIPPVFYAAIPEMQNHPYNPRFEDDPDYEKITTNHSLTLRVKHIMPVTYRYYRSLRQQREGIDFFSEPVTVIHNIENGFGSFAVHNTASVTLLEWKTHEYQRKEE